MSLTVFNVRIKTMVIVFTIFVSGIYGDVDQTRLCRGADAYKVLAASLRTTVKFSLCIEAHIPSSNYPVVKYDRTWILVNSRHDKFEFTVDSTISLEHSHVILFTLHNVTVQDYGSNELKILTQQNQGLDFTFYLTPPGEHKVNFVAESLHDEANESLLKCYSSWYPKSVSLQKKWSASSRQVVDNTKALSERVSLDLLVSSCSEAGTYECNITDFDGIVTTKALQANFNECPPRLCDWQSNDLTVLAEVNDTVHAAVCLFSTEHFDIHHWLRTANNTTASSNFIVSSTPPADGIFYRYVNITVRDVQAADYGGYNLVITTSPSSSLLSNVRINLRSKHSTDFCSGTINNTNNEANIGQAKTIYFCITAVEGLQNLIEINKSPYAVINNTIKSAKYKLHIDQLVAGKHRFALDILNVKSNAALNYTVKVQSNLGIVLIYRFSLRLKNGSLKLCKNENDLLTAKLHSTAVIHICVTTDAGIGSYLALDNNIDVNSTVLLRVNGSSRGEKYGASAHPRSDNATTDYFIQIYIRNVTWKDYRGYRITVKPILDIELAYEFVLEPPLDATLEFCDSSIPKLYYFSTFGHNFDLAICVKTDDAISEHVWINEHAYLRKQHAGHVITSHKRLKNPKRHLLTLTLANITVDNFTRYDITLQFREASDLSFTFYLLENKALQTLPCPGCTTDPVTYATIGGQAFFCFITYGAMDTDVIINNRTYAIDEHGETLKFGLESHWSESRRINYIKLEVHDIVVEDFKKYELSLASVDKHYSFVLHQLKVASSPQIKSFTVKSKSRTIESISSTLLVKREDNLQLTCTAEQGLHGTSIEDEDGTRINQTSGRTNAVGVIKNVQCESSWSYVCRANAFQNTPTVSKWIHLAIEECPSKLCSNESLVRTLSTPVGNSSVLSVCVIAYVDNGVNVYWNGHQMSPSTGKYRFVYRKKPGFYVKHFFEIVVTNITSSDFGKHNLSIKLGSKKSLDLRVEILKAESTEKDKGTQQNHSINIIIIISVTAATVLIVLVLCFFFRNKINLCRSEKKLLKNSEHLTYVMEEKHDYEEIQEPRKPKSKNRAKKPLKNPIYRPPQTKENVFTRGSLAKDRRTLK